MRNDFNPRLLFVAKVNYPKYSDLRQYLEQELSAMIDDGSFCLTEILMQEPHIVDMCGDIIRGMEIDNGKYGPAQYKNQKISRHKIRVRNINTETSAKGDKSFLYKVGKKPVINPWNRWGNRIKQLADEFLEVPEGEQELSVEDAWLLLKNHGKFAKKALTKEKQARLWKAEEITPQEIKENDQIKNKGRQGIKIQDSQVSAGG